MAPKLPSSLGLPVSTRDFSLFEMVSRAWGSEFFAPDHRIYQFGGVRFFDSTDLGFTGIYSSGVSQVSGFSLTATNNPINPTAINLTWTLATVYGDEIDFYNIFRSVNSGPFTLLVSISAIQAGFQPSYVDSNLTTSNTYSYYVLAIADVGSTPGAGTTAASGPSNGVTVGPATPPVLFGTLIGTTEIDLTWTASTVVDSTIANYFLYRQVDGGGFSLLTTTDGVTLAFNDLTVSAGHTYDYYVVAQPALGFASVPSNTVTETISGASIDALIDIAFLGVGYVVGVTPTGNAAWSSDSGVTTNPVVLPLANINQFNMVQSGNGIAVALGQDPDLGNRLLRTTDGITWTDTTPVGIAFVFGIYFSPLFNEFIAWDGGSNRIYTSPNGITWTSHVGTHELGTFTASNFVETGGALYVGAEGTTVDQVWKTTNGFTYSISLATPLNAITCLGPVLNGTVFGAAPVTSIFGTNEIWTSPDAVTWAKKSTGISFNTVPPYANIQGFGGFFVTGAQIGGDGKTIATSPDGVTWTNRTPTVTVFGTSQPAIRSTSSALYVFGGGCAHTSDFSAWTLDVTDTNTVNQVKEGFLSIVGGGADALGVGRFFNLGNSSWTSRPHPTISFLLSNVVFGDGVFILTDASAPVNVARSVDAGMTWTVQSLATPGVTSQGLATDGAGVWLLGTGAPVGQSARVWVSTDNGVTWNVAAGIPFTIDLPITAIGFGNGRWIAAASSFPHSYTSISTDNGATWSVPINISTVIIPGNDSVLWDGTNFSITGFDHITFSPLAYITSDGTLGTTVSLPANSQLDHHALVFGNGQYMIANASAEIVYSAATIVGLNVASPQTVTFLGDTTDASVNCVAFGNFNGTPTWMAFGDAGGTAKSTDNGATWTGLELNFQPPGGGFSADSAAFGSNTFVAIGSSDNISTLP